MAFPSAGRQFTCGDVPAILRGDPPNGLARQKYESTRQASCDTLTDKSVTDKERAFLRPQAEALAEANGIPVLGIVLSQANSRIAQELMRF